MPYCPHCESVYGAEVNGPPFCYCGHPTACCRDLEDQPGPTEPQRLPELDLFGLAEAGASNYELKLLVEARTKPGSREF